MIDGLYIGRIILPSSSDMRRTQTKIVLTAHVEQSLRL